MIMQGERCTGPVGAESVTAAAERGPLSAAARPAGEATTGSAEAAGAASCATEPSGARELTT